MSTVLTTNKVAAVAIAVAMFFTVALATPAKAATVQDLTAQIASLLATIQGLQAQLATMSGGSTTTTGTTYNFTKDYSLGDSDAGVVGVQKFLNANGFAVAATGAGSPGNETSYYGSRTVAAVKAFQNANAAKVLTPVGLSVGTGYWGPSTRAEANTMGSTTSTTNGNTTTTTTTGTGVTVSAATQPANGLAVGGAARVPFTKFTVTNNSGAAQTINSVTVQRGGLMDNAVFSGIVLLNQGGWQIGNSQTLNSVDQATIGAPVTIAAGASETFTVAGNMSSGLTNKAGQVGTLSVIAVNTSATVTGSLPITGASQTINGTLSIGSLSSVTVSSFDPNGAQTKNIGDTSVRFAGLRFTAGSVEDLIFNGIRFRMNGSVSASDLSNLKAYVNGTTYPVTVSADGRYVTAKVPGITLKKGFSMDVYLTGDISGSNASGRTAEFDVDKTSDVYFTGATYGYGVQPSIGGGTVQTGTHGTTITSGQPWFQGSTIKITGASVTSIARASAVPASNVAVNIPNTTLGGFAINLKGEPLNVQSLKFGVTYTMSRGTQTTNNVLTNVTLVDQNGQVIAGPSDEVWTSTTAGTVTLSNSVTFPTGNHTYTLKGTISSNVTGGTITMKTTPSTDWTNVTGQTTGNSIVLPSSTVNMNPMTVKVASLAESTAATPVAQTIVAGATDVTLATIRLDASNSGANVRFSNLPVVFTNPANLSTCRLYNGTTNLTTGSNVISTPGATGTFILDNSFVVNKGTVASLDIVCNISSSATTPAAAGVPTLAPNAITGITATTVTSNNTVNVTNANTGSGTGNTMIIGSGAVVMSTSASSPALAMVAGGLQNVILGVWNMRATNENVRVEQLGLSLTGNTQDLTGVTLWSGGVKIAGPIVFTGNFQAVTLTTPLVLTKDTDTAITIKGNVALIGGSNPGTNGATLAVNWDNTSTNNQLTGVQSGKAIVSGGALTGATAVAGVIAYKTVATIANTSSTISASGASDGRLIRFSVTADSAGSIGIAQVPFKVTYAGTGTTVANAKLYAFTDSSYSTPVAGLTNGGQVGSTQVVVASTTAYKINASASPVQVGAGQTVYFELRADVVASTGASVVTVISGDATKITPVAYATAATSNFVWSPNTSGTTAAGTTDWINGANVKGLPSSGFSKARGL